MRYPTCYKRYHGLRGLTDREVEVIKAFASLDVNSDKEVAVKLYISHTTLAAHKQSIFSKIGVKSRTGITHFALACGLVKNLYADEPNG